MVKSRTGMLWTHWADEDWLSLLEAERSGCGGEMVSSVSQRQSDNHVQVQSKKTRLVDAFSSDDIIGIHQLPLSGTRSLLISSTHAVYPVQLEVYWISTRWILEISSTMGNI